MALSHLSDLVGRVLASRYRIVAPLGNGASGRVYLADDTQLRRRVAVKVLHDTMAGDAAFLKRFQAEAHAAAALNHPNVMHVYDSGTDEGVPYLVCEFLGGGSLRGMLDAGSRLTTSQALLVGLDTARGLDYAHRQGLVHRDIKPANLLFGEEGRLRIGDFGLARAIAEAAWTEPQGMLLGTARYAAPEQAQGKTLDGRADVYALALVLVEAVTGTVPFASDTTMATLMARCEGDLVVPPELGRLVPVLERAGKLDPAERCDAGELEIGFMAAAEDMERPQPLPLVGAIAADEIVAEPGFGGGEPVQSAAVRDDITIVLGATPVVLPDAPRDAEESGDANGAETDLAEPVEPADTVVVVRGEPVQGIDIPLDSDPVSIVGVPGAPAVPPLTIGPDPATGSGSGSDTDTKRRRRWPRVLGVLVVLALVAGAAVVGFLLLRTPSADVPNLVGKSLTEANEVASHNGWEVRTDLSRKDGTVPDEVIGQRPDAGTSLDEGKTLHLDVSLGPTLVAMPQLANQPKDAAIAAITAAGLVPGAITEANDEQVPAGSVIKAVALVDGSGQLPKGSDVALEISTGPTPRAMPAGLAGQSLDAVRNALAAVQLGVKASEEFSDQPVGTVLSLSQPDGASLPRDTVVQATVSKGPAPVPIPDVAGQPVAQATAALQAAGFPVSGVEGSPTGKVLATDPPAGEPHQKGTSVRLFTRA